MKPTALVIALIAFATGCSTSVQTANTPSTRTASARPASAETPAVMPYSEAGPPGSMDFEWEPTPPPPPKKIRPREMDAKPHFVSDKKRRGRLFVAPTINQR